MLWLIMFTGDLNLAFGHGDLYINNEKEKRKGGLNDRSNISILNLWQVCHLLDMIHESKHSFSNQVH